MSGTMLQVRELSHAYGVHHVLRGIDLSLRQGEIVALVGPNGAGKSTLLKLLLGFLPLQRGEVEVMGRPIAGLSRREIARWAAFVPQGYEARFSFTAREMVAMGRTPWLARFQPEGEHDRQAVAEAMEAADVTAIAERPLPELSGGEHQRVLLARAFAQRTPVLVLDEPNASLDMRHAFELLELVRRRVHGEGGAAIAALHDLTLAARFCDRIVTLSDGRVADDGPPDDVLTPDRIEHVFGVRTRVLRDEDGRLLLSVIGPA